MKKQGIGLRISALILLLALLSSCVGGTDPTQATESTTDFAEDTVSTAGYICISGGAYTLVRPDKANDNVMEVFRLLSNELTELQGSRFSINNDFVGYDQEIPQDRFEILIGSTNRADSSDALSTLTAGQWKISIKGTHILIVGADDSALRMAAEIFLSECVVTLNGALYVREDLDLI